MLGLKRSTAQRPLRLQGVGPMGMLADDPKLARAQVFCRGSNRANRAEPCEPCNNRVVDRAEPCEPCNNRAVTVQSRASRAATVQSHARVLESKIVLTY